MNFIVNNKPARWRPTKPINTLDNRAQHWLAQFPNNRPSQPHHPTRDSTNISINSSATHPSCHTPFNQQSPSTSFLYDNNNITTTTTNNATAVDPTSQLVIVALSLGRGHASTEIGLATMDAHSPSLTLSQFSDNMSYGGLLIALNLHAPSQILLPNTLFEQQPPAPVLSRIAEYFPHLSLVAIDRSRFNSHKGIAALLAICLPGCAEQLQANVKQYYALSAAAAVLDYVQSTVVRMPLAENSVAVRFAGRHGSMHIDVESAHRLELLYPLCPSIGGGGRGCSVTTTTTSPNRPPTCLFSVLNACRTHIGQRNLRARILQPSCDLADIASMHACIEECRHDGGQRLDAVRSVLGKFVAVDRLVRIAYRMPQVRDDNFRTAEVLISQALQLRTCVDAVPLLFRRLSELGAERFGRMRDMLRDERLPRLSQRIEEVLGGEAGAVAGAGVGRAQFSQRMYAVRKGLNGMLDLNRTIYAALMDDVNAEVERLRETYGLPLRLMYSKVRGFHVQQQVRRRAGNKAAAVAATVDGGVERMLDEMEVLQRGRSVWLLTNEALRNLNVRIGKYIDEIHYVSTAIIANLLQELRGDIGVIYDLCGVVAELDVVAALVHVSLANAGEYARPTFGREMRIVQAVHPFRGDMVARGQPVANNVLATEEYNFYAITGPNMSGKTIYLKMIAVLQIMAQLGCYVPAKSAQFRLCDRLFTRMGFGDCIGRNASSFVLEVREMCYILRNVTARSLVVIDELCRSTNDREGERIARRVCEQLLGVSGSSEEEGGFTAPFVFFTTHFPSIGELVDRHLNVVNLNFNVTETLDAHQKLHLIYTHQLQEGSTRTSGYGLALARSVRFPRSMLQRAERIVQLTTAGSNGSHHNTSAVTNTNTVATRSQISNPVNRTYPQRTRYDDERGGDHSNASGTVLSMAMGNSSTQYGSIGQFERNVHDLYANLTEVFRSTNARDEEDLAGCVNDRIEEFMNVIDRTDADALQSLDVAEIMLTFRTVIDAREDQDRARKLKTSKAMNSSNSFKSKWFTTVGRLQSSQPVIVPTYPTPLRSMDDPHEASGYGITASGTSASKLSLHSLMRRYAPAEKPQLASTSSTTTTNRNTSGFEHMPGVFWDSMDDYENGPEHDELREFIINGTTESSDRKRTATDAVEVLSSSDSLHSCETPSSVRRVRFADECAYNFNRVEQQQQSQQQPSNSQQTASFELFEDGLPIECDVVDSQSGFSTPRANATPPGWQVANDWNDIFADLDAYTEQGSQMPEDADLNIHEDVYHTPSNGCIAVKLLPKTDSKNMSYIESQTSSRVRRERIDTYLTDQYEHTVLNHYCPSQSTTSKPFTPLAMCMRPEQSQEITSSTTISEANVADAWKPAPALQSSSSTQKSFSQIAMDVGLAARLSPINIIDIVPPETPMRIDADNADGGMEEAVAVEILLPAPPGF